MIRREQAAHVAMIPHAERSRVAAVLARHIGNQQFLPLAASVLLAAETLDAGWQAFDADHPVLDAAQLDRTTTLDLWQASAELAAERDPYGGLLVTLVGFWNSMRAGADGASLWNPGDPRVRFDLNRFQHAMIERMEALRPRCGLRIDRPLKYGLAEASRDAAELQLRRDFTWLQTIDGLSLALCRGRMPAATLSAWPRGGGAAVDLHADVLPHRVTLNPWPFALRRFDVTVAGAPPAQPFTIEVTASTI